MEKLLPLFYAFKWSLLISSQFNFTTYLTDCLKDYSVYLYTIECSAFRFKIIYKHISVLYISLPVVIGCAIWQASSIKVGWTACNLAVSMNNKRSYSQLSPNSEALRFKFENFDIFIWGFFGRIQSGFKNL